MQPAITRGALTLVLFAGLSVPVSAMSREEVVRAGRYELSFWGRNVGEEAFIIYRTSGGYRIEATVVPTAGDQVPSESVYVVDQDRRFVSATYRQLIDGGAEATYRLEDGCLVAEAIENGQRLEQRIALEPDAVVTGPHYVTDFFVLEPLRLELKGKTTQPVYAFGFEDWRVARMELVSKRESDRKVKTDSGDRINAVVYRCHIRTGDDTIKTRSWLDDEGVSVRITIDAPLGSVNIRLTQS
jgi:hypothetical protein